MGYTLQQYSERHKEGIKALFKSIGWARQYIDGQMLAIEKLSTIEQGIVIVALSEGKLIAFAQAEHHAWNRLTQIQGLAVLPKFRRKGIAQTLIEALESFAHEHEARGMIVDTPVDNTGARSFYESRKYKHVCTIPEYYDVDVDGAVYTKIF